MDVLVESSSLHTSILLCETYILYLMADNRIRKMSHPLQHVRTMIHFTFVSPACQVTNLVGKVFSLKQSAREGGGTGCLTPTVPKAFSYTLNRAFFIHFIEKLNLSLKWSNRTGLCHTDNQDVQYSVKYYSMFALKSIHACQYWQPKSCLKDCNFKRLGPSSDAPYFGVHLQHHRSKHSSEFKSGT